MGKMRIDTSATESMYLYMSDIIHHKSVGLVAKRTLGAVYLLAKYYRILPDYIAIAWHFGLRLNAHNFVYACNEADKR